MRTRNSARKASAAALLLAALWLIAACGNEAPSTAPSIPAGAQLAISDVSRAPAPDVSPEVAGQELEDLVAGNNEFALELFQSLAEDDENLFLSPYSISLALAMTYAGARGSTEQQFSDTLNFPLPQNPLHPRFNRLDLDLTGEKEEFGDDEVFRLNIVNAIWGQQGFEFLAPFLDTIAENYGAGLRLLDFQNAPDPSRVTINDWVSEQTEGKIEDLIPPDAINTLTRLVLTNGIYFNADWVSKFDESRTADGPFHLLDGGAVTVPMMRQIDPHPYAGGDDFQAVELLYRGRDTSMVILLPTDGQFEAFRDSLTATKLLSIIESLERQRVILSMPMFEFESEFSLRDTLTQMGMPDAFSPEDADFSGMTTHRRLFIADVFHKAFVAVDEAGTEAAAATAVIVQLQRGSVNEPVVIDINRPFIFFIRDIETNTILFQGQVTNPGS